MTDLLILSDPVSYFWKCPQKFFFFFFWHFLTTFLDAFGLIRSVKTFSKVLGVGMNVGPYMAYIFYIQFFILYTKKGVLGVQQISSHVSGIFLAILAIKMADFFKLKLFLRPFL